MSAAESEWSDPELWAKIRSGDLAARAELIEGNYGLVQRISGKMARRLPQHADADDITSFGTLGLLRAVENYDPQSPVHFETYAAASIRSLILDELRSMDWAPRSLRKRQRLVDEAAQALTHELQREPTPAEIAAKMGLKPSDVTEIYQATKASHHKSMEELDPERSSSLPSGPWTHSQPGTNRHEDSKQAHEAMERLIGEIREMPLLDQAVLTLKYFAQEPNPKTGQLEPLKLKVVGERLGITEQRASQVHSRAVVKVRDLLRDVLGAGTGEHPSERVD